MVATITRCNCEPKHQRNHLGSGTQRLVAGGDSSPTPTSRTFMPASPTASTWNRIRQAVNEIQAAGATGPHDHTYLSLGTFYFDGRSVQRFDGSIQRITLPC